MRKIGVSGIYIQRTPIVIIRWNRASPIAKFAYVISKAFRDVMDFLVADKLVGIMRNRRFF
jgi:hypothetical protein